MGHNKTREVEVVNRRYYHPRNIIFALTEKLTHQKVFEGGGGFLGLGVSDPTGSFDPTGTDGEIQTSGPPEIIPVDEDTDIEFVQPGMVLEERLGEDVGFFVTTYPVDYFYKVWFDDVLAFPTIHWVVSGSNALIPNDQLISGTIVIGQYVVGYD